MIFIFLFMFYNVFMKRILLTIEYDGTNYSGWQKQPNVSTIQGEIEKAIFNSIGQEVEIFGSGRTDAKVHALNQKAHFDLAVPVPVSKLAEIINNCLPDDIVIKEAVEVDENFHARFSLIRKCYRYKIYNSEQKNAFLANRVGYVRRKLDISKMRQASSLFIGEHNFRGFCSSNTCAENFVRTIYDIKIAEEDNFIKIDVCGSGFLYNMVRIIVGTLVDYSLGKLTLEDIKIALNEGKREYAGQTMAPQGLYLKDAIYE